MQINFDWGGSITGSANASQIEAAFNQAAQNLEGLFSNPVTITIDAEWGNLGASAVADNNINFEQGYYYSYSQLVSALTAESSQNPVDAIALASLPATDPQNSAESGGDGYWIRDAERKALGLLPANSGEVDATVTLNSSQNFAWSSGQSGDDPVGALEHEISEVMGRTGSLPVSGAPNVQTALDLFRFLPNGVRNYGLYIPNVQNIAGNFSIDGQVLSELQYPTSAFAQQTPYDNYDWYSTSGYTNNDDFGFAPIGYEGGKISADDVEEMQVLGWELTNVGDSTIGPGQTLSFEEIGDLPLRGSVVQKGSLEVSGGFTSGMEVGDNGTENVVSGGYASETLIGSGGNQTVGNLGTSNDTLVYSGGVEIVSSGGTSFSTNILSGGTQNVSSGGVSYYTSAANFGTQDVFSSGTASGSVVLSGGVQNVLDGGVTRGTVFSGGIQNVAGMANEGVVQDGSQIITTGGVAIAATVEDEVVYPPQGSLSSSPYASTYGYQLVSSGGVASQSLVELGGTQVVSSGGEAIDATISGTNFSGTPITGPVTSLPQGLDILSGTQEIRSSGSAIGTRVEAYGVQEVFAGGTAIGTIVDNFGQTTVAGGTASATVVSSGGALDGGGTAIGSIVYEGGTEDVTSATGCTVSGGTEVVGAFCVASNTKVLAGGVQSVDGGTATGAVLNSGTQYVSSGNFFAGIVTGTAIGTQVNNGGQEFVFYRDVTSNTVIAADGTEYVSSGGTAVGTVIDNGGVEQVFSGGIASGSVISGGILMLSGGAVIVGGVHFAGGGELSIGGTSSPSGVISGLASGDIIDLSGSTFTSGGSVRLQAGNVLEVVEEGVTYNLQLDPTANLESLPFELGHDGASGTDIYVGSISQVGNNYDLLGKSGFSTSLKFAGRAFTSGEAGAWVPIASVQTASGYDVAWKNTSTGQYTAWALNSSGNYTSNHLGAVSGTSFSLESLETTFGQDLNSDGTIGPTKTLVRTDGSTSLTQVANEYFLYAAGGTSGPSLKVGGTAVTLGEYGDTAPIGAIKTATGYEIAWENSSTDRFTFWATDSNGNYTSNITGLVSGTNATLKSLEATFYQDFNGDGVIDTPTTVINVTGHVVLPLSSVTQPAAIAAGATLELTGADTSSVMFKGTTGTLQLDSSTGFSGTVAGMTGQDTLDLRDIDFADIQTPSFSGNSTGGTLSVTDGTHTAGIALLGNYLASTFAASSDGHGGTSIIDPHTAANQSALLAQSQHA
jgi:autotransporter passenger strand-loop-strand repeat protein